MTSSGSYQVLLQAYKRQTQLCTHALGSCISHNRALQCAQLWCCLSL